MLLFGPRWSLAGAGGAECGAGAGGGGGGAGGVGGADEAVCAEAGVSGGL